MKPKDFQWIEFYESNSQYLYQGLRLDLGEEELIICSTIIDEINYSNLTTRKLITVENVKERLEHLVGATGKGYGDFKGYSNHDIAFGLVQLENGDDLKHFIETGKASMIMIYAVRTLIRCQE